MARHVSSVASFEYKLPMEVFWEYLSGFLSGSYKPWIPGIAECTSPAPYSRINSGKIFEFRLANGRKIKGTLECFADRNDHPRIDDNIRLQLNYTKNVSRTYIIRLFKSYLIFYQNSAYTGFLDVFGPYFSNEESHFDATIREIMRFDKDIKLTSRGYD